MAIGIGVGLYFALRVEPPLWLGLGVLALAIAVWRLAPRRRLAARALVFAALGFAAADLRAASVDAPALARPLSIRDVEGVAVNAPAGERFIIALTRIEGVAPEDLPARARISWRGDPVDIHAGDVLTFRAGLRPPPPPALPGGFDFARVLYFQRIGAVGYAVTRPAITERAGSGSVRTRIENARTGLTRRILAAAPGEGGAIVAAVITGEREAVSEAAQNALRDAGLAHLLAISGLHMGLATGLIFFAVRAGLAAIEPLALRFPIKKWAAAIALLSGLGYLLLSGGGWSPRRAFIMTAIVFLAILVDRRAISLRNVAVAASLILLTTPEALVHPGFQMSFAAVTALIAAFEWWTSRRGPSERPGLADRLRRYAGGVLATDFIASSATAPFAIYHFNRVALYSLPANFLAMPLMAFWIMPAAVAGLLLLPFGLDGAAWRVAAAGVEAVLAIGRTVAGMPGAVALVPQWPAAALVVLSLGGLWLCLVRSPLRLLGLLAAPAAGLLALAEPSPDLFVVASGENAALFRPDNERQAFYAYHPRRDRFSIGVWREALGVAGRGADPMRQAGRCDEAGCVVAAKGAVISVIEDPLALAEDCARADLVIALFPVSGADWKRCAAILIDKRSVWRRGAHEAFFEADGVRVRTVEDARGARPWTAQES